MRTPTRDRALAAIQRYRASSYHDAHAGRCRLRPTCSHYAEDALRSHRLPWALILIALRILSCNPITAPRRPGLPAKLLSVLALSGITTALVCWTAAAATAAPMPRLEPGSPRTAGDCDAHVGGVPIGTLDSDHPLQVHKNQRIVLTGLAPPNIRNLPTSLGLRSTTVAKVHFIEKIATREYTNNGTGQRFQRSVNVDTYLKYGSGVYRVDMTSNAPGGWSCSATFYVEMHGSKLAAEVAVAVGAIGTAGMMASARGGEPEPEPKDELPPKPDEFGTYDPEISAEKLDAIEASKDRAANAGASGTACLAGILFALIASTGAFAAAAPVPARSRKRVWVRGHAIMGLLSGLIAGVGITVALQQFGVWRLDAGTAIAFPVFIGIVGAVRGWWGSAWRVS